MNGQPGTNAGGDKLIGTWTVHDVTAVFKDRPETDIRKALSEFDQGKRDLSTLAPGEAAGAPAIGVEIRPAGEMKMTILRSMRPDLPGTMKIGAAIRWTLDGDRMQTQADPASLTVRINLEGGPELTGARFAEAKRKAGEIEVGALQGMKGDPLWNNANTVAVLHAGPRAFLTRGAAGNLMLHVRKEAANE